MAAQNLNHISPFINYMTMVKNMFHKLQTTACPMLDTRFTSGSSNVFPRTSLQLQTVFEAFLISPCFAGSPTA